MKYFIFLAFIFSLNLFGQFTIEGKLDNLPNQDLYISINKGIDVIYKDKIKTTEDGRFKYQFKDNYIGIINIQLPEINESFSAFSNNENIKLKGDYTNNRLSINYLDDNNIKFKSNDYTNTKQYRALPTLIELETYYDKTDPFYIPLLNEINKINAQINQNNIINSNLVFYNGVIKTMNKVDQKSSNYLPEVENILINGPEFFDNSGLVYDVLITYFNLKTSQMGEGTDKLAYFEKIVDDLLDKTDIETSRGQTMLNSVISLTNRYEQFKSLNPKYLEMAKKLTCEISPELKKNIKVNSEIQIGKPFPNFTLPHPSGDKKNIYAFKNPYKVVIIWASWCPHCQQEKDKILSYYVLNKPQKDIEFIAFGVENNKKKFQDFTQDLPWINDTDYLYWNSPITQELGIDGTPTYFLLDKDNKIMKISSHFDEISPLIP